MHRKRIEIVAAALLVTATVVGCNTSTTDTNTDRSWTAPAPPSSMSAEPPSQRGAPDLPTVETMRPDRADALQVMRAFCEIVFSRNAATENSFSTSLWRAENLMTPKLASDLLQAPKNVRPLPQWVQWQRQQAWIRAAATEASDEHPPDSPTNVSRVFVVEEHPYAGDGDELDAVQSVAWVTATKESGSWWITQFTASHDY